MQVLLHRIPCCTLNNFIAYLNCSDTGCLVAEISSFHCLLSGVSPWTLALISLSVMMLGGCLLIVEGQSQTSHVCHD